MKEISIKIKPLKVSLILLGIAGCLAVISTLVWYLPKRFQFDIGRLYELFYVDLENNFPTYYSVLLFLFCAVLIVFIIMMKKSEKNAYIPHWVVLAIGFFYMSCDDFMLLHEKLTKTTNQLLGARNLNDFFNFSWIIPACIIVVIIGIAYIKFLLYLPRRTMWIFIIAGGIFLAGSIGLEMIGGYITKNLGQYAKEYVIETTIEETLELIGPIVFIYGCLDYILKQYGQIKIILQKVTNADKGAM